MPWWDEPIRIPQQPALKLTTGPSIPLYRPRQSFPTKISKQAAKPARQAPTSPSENDIRPAPATMKDGTNHLLKPIYFGSRKDLGFPLGRDKVSRKTNRLRPKNPYSDREHDQGISFTDTLQGQDAKGTIRTLWRGHFA